LMEEKAVCLCGSRPVASCDQAMRSVAALAGEPTTVAPRAAAIARQETSFAVERLFIFLFPSGAILSGLMDA
ncbi:hypothetical protein J8J20_26270, partial [Mycobacterium tuberculosis]|nr:hypothetical protein [Mycobacterium tuberculosis]